MTAPSTAADARGRVPDVDVATVTYNSATTVPAALASVLATDRVKRTIVVDNASADGSADAARAAGAGMVIENTANVGFAAAVNRALPECDAKYVLLLNPDAELDAAALDLLADALDERDDAVMVGPVLVEGGRIELGARRFSTAVNRLLWHVPSPWRPSWSTPAYADAAAMAASPQPVPVDYLWGAALLARRGFLRDIGGLDERFFLYSEDEDLGRQAWGRGDGCLLVPRARARHLGGASTPDEAMALARIIAANAQLLQKWEGALSAAVYRRLIGPVMALRALVLGLAGRTGEAATAGRVRSLLREPPASAGIPLPGPLRQVFGYATGTLRLVTRVIRRPGLLLTPLSGEFAGPSSRPDHGPADLAFPQSPDGVAAPEPLVSVILPVHNAASHHREYLRTALDSVAVQKLLPYELIIVDDGSTDGTVDLVDDILRAHPDLRAQVARKENGGQSSARNLGAQLSRGDWLGFLDQDDMWTPDHLSAVRPYLTNTVDMVYTDADTMDEMGVAKEVGVHRNLGLGGGHPKIGLADAISQDVFVMPGVMTIRKEFFHALGGFDEALSGYEDDDLFVRSWEAGRLSYVPISTLRWRIHDSSASHTVRMIESGVRYWRKLMARCPATPQGEELARCVTLRFVRVFLSYASLQVQVNDPLFRDNLVAAESLIRHLGVVDRAAFALTHWAWRRPTFAARCARSWFLNGLEATL